MGRNLVSPILCDTAADVAALFDGAKMFSKSIVEVTSISATSPVPGRYRWVAGSTAADSNASQLVVVPTTGGASGRWLRCDQYVDLVLPFTFATANGAALCTCPAGLTMWLTTDRNLWEVTTTPFSGGAATAIGLSVQDAAITSSAGDLAGGAAGDGIPNSMFTTTGFWYPTNGGYATGDKGLVIQSTGYVEFNRIASAYTAGVGNAHVSARLIANGVTPPPP